MSTVAQGAAVNARSLQSALSKVIGVIRARSLKPILSCIRLEIGERSTVLATNLEVSIEATIEAEGDPMRVCIDSAKLSAIAGVCGESLSIEQHDGGNVRLIGGRSEWTLPTMRVDEYPQWTKIESEPAVVSCAALREAIRRTEFATGGDSRYVFGAIKLESKGKTLNVVGCDGHRVSIMEIPVTRTVNAMLDASFARQLVRALPDGGECSLRFNTSCIEAEADGVVFSARQTEGRYPPWDIYASRRPDSTKIELQAGAVAAAVRQAALVLDNVKTGVRFDFENGTLRVQARVADSGECLAESPIAYDGPPHHISLKARMFSDFLKVIEPTAMFTFDIKNPDSVVMLYTDDGYSHIIAPLPEG